MRRIDKKKGPSRVHAMAMYDRTWRDFKEFKDYYGLSAENAMRVLLDSWNPMRVSKESKEQIANLATNKPKSKAEAIKRAKTMLNGNELTRSRLINDKDNKDRKNKGLDLKGFI